MLNVGLTVDFIMAYAGDLDQAIALPKGDGQEMGVDIAGPLTATRHRGFPRGDLRRRRRRVRREGSLRGRAPGGLNALGRHNGVGGSDGFFDPEAG